MSAVPDDESEELQTVDYSIRLTLKFPKSWTSQEVIDPIVEMLGDLYGVIDTKIVRWSRVEIDSVTGERRPVWSSRSHKK